MHVKNGDKRTNERTDGKLNSRSRIYTWKSRSYNHTASFDHISKRKHSGLSQYVWDLKEKGWRFKISWALIKRCSSYSPSTDTCRLCLEEKHMLMMKPDLGTLNVEDEFYASCRHRDPLLLSKIV